MLLQNMPPLFIDARTETALCAKSDARVHP